MEPEKPNLRSEANEVSETASFLGLASLVGVSRGCRGFLRVLKGFSRVLERFSKGYWRQFYFCSTYGFSGVSKVLYWLLWTLKQLDSFLRPQKQPHFLVPPLRLQGFCESPVAQILL